MESGREDSLYNHRAEETPPPYLFGRIVSKIRTEEKLAVSKQRTAYVSLAFVGSIAACVAASFTLEGALVRSELFQLFPVIFSDPGAIAANWQDFTLYLLESLPITSLAICSIAFFALLESMKYTAQYLGETISLSKLTKSR